MKALIIGLLAARGVALANDATEQTVITKLNDEFAKAAGTGTALANDKATLTSSLTSVTSERDTLKRTAEQSATALANEQTAHVAERKARAEMAVDLIITQGKLTVAQRDEKVTALANAADFDAEFKKLSGAAAVVKTASTTEAGKQQAALANDSANVGAEYQSAFAAEMQATGSALQAHNNIMRFPKYQGLALKLTQIKAPAF